MEEEEEGGGEGEDKLDYNYLLSLSMWSLSLEKKEELLKKRDEKVWREGGKEEGGVKIRLFSPPCRQLS